MQEMDFEEALKNSKMLKEAEDIKQELFILMWEMDGIQRRPSLHNDEITKMLRQLNIDYKFITNLISTLKSVNETI